MKNIFAVFVFALTTAIGFGQTVTLQGPTPIPGSTVPHPKEYHETFASAPFGVPGGATLTLTRTPSTGSMVKITAYNGLAVMGSVSFIKSPSTPIVLELIDGGTFNTNATTIVVEYYTN